MTRRLPNNIGHHRKDLVLLSWCVAIFAASSMNDTFGATIVENFSDDSIQDGDPLSWSIAGAFSSGTYSVDNGALTLEAQPGTSLGLIAEDLDLSDLSVRARMRFEDGGEFGGVQVRSSGGGSSGYLVWTVSDGTTIWLWESGGRGQIINRFPPTRPGDEPFTALRDFFLQVDAVGNDVSIWAWNAGNAMPELPLIAESLDTYESGSVMFWVQDTSGPNSTRAIVTEVIISDTHIVPEPSTVVLSIAAALAILASRFSISRRLRFVGEGRDVPRE